MAKHTIQVTIVYNGKGKSEECDAHCGIDWSSAETITLINERIKERFGDRVKLDYLDLSKPRTNHHVPELNLVTKNENLPLPLLVINGQSIISGQFDIRLLLDAIDAEIEIKSK